MFMKVVFHEDLKRSYSREPAAKEDRMERVLDVIGRNVEFVEPKPAGYVDTIVYHTIDHRFTLGK